MDPTVAFLWTRRDGTRAIPLLPGDASSAVGAINDRSLVAGGGLTTRASTCQHPWVWLPRWSTPALLPTLTGVHPETDCPNGLATLIASVNSSGVIVGQTAAASGAIHAVRWSPVGRGRDHEEVERDGHGDR